jgi:ATP-dependent Clp protease ATP-binding subunit ClpB
MNSRSGKLDPVIGRDEEIRRVLQILTEEQNNPMLWENPEGKLLLLKVWHTESWMATFLKPKDKIVYSLDMGALIAVPNTRRRTTKICGERSAAAEGDIVLFIDEIHTLVGAGGGEGVWMRPTS